MPRVEGEEFEQCLRNMGCQDWPRVTISRADLELLLVKLNKVRDGGTSVCTIKKDAIEGQIVIRAVEHDGAGLETLAEDLTKLTVPEGFKTYVEPRKRPRIISEADQKGQN